MFARLRGIGRVAPSTAKDNPTACPGVGYGSWPTTSTPDAGQGLPESPQQVCRRGQYAMPGGHFARDKGEGFAQLRLHRRQRFRPVRSNQRVQRPARQVREAEGVRGCGLQLEQRVGFTGGVKLGIKHSTHSSAAAARFCARPNDNPVIRP